MVRRLGPQSCTKLQIVIIGSLISNSVSISVCTGIADRLASHCWSLNEQECSEQYVACIWTDCKGTGKCVGMDADLSNGCDGFKDKETCDLLVHYCSWLEPPVCITGSPVTDSHQTAYFANALATIQVCIAYILYEPSKCDWKEAIFLMSFVFVCRAIGFLLEVMALLASYCCQPKVFISDEEMLNNLMLYDELIEGGTVQSHGKVRGAVSPDHESHQLLGSSRSMELEATESQRQRKLWTDLSKREQEEVRNRFGVFFAIRWGYTPCTIVFWGFLRLVLGHVVQIGIASYIFLFVPCETLCGKIAKMYSICFIFTYGLVVVIVFSLHVLRWVCGRDQLALLNFSYYFVLPLTALLAQNLASQRPLEAYWQITWDAAFFFQRKPARHFMSMMLLQVFLADRMWVIGSFVILRAARCLPPRACCGLVKCMLSLPLWVVVLDCLIAPFVWLYLILNYQHYGFWTAYGACVSGFGMLSCGALFLIGWRSEAVLRWNLGFN